ncbi:MAG: CAP domain-containing protein [Dehalococcoidia bacterium]
MRRPLIATILAAALLAPFLAPSTASAALTGLDSEELAAIDAINEVRADLGLPALKLSPTLTNAAEWMAQDLADRDTIDHTDSLGRPMAQRIYAFGYPTNAYIRENLVVGTNLSDGLDAVAQWQNSPGHRANNEADDVTVAGIARVHDPDTQWKWFWVLNLGSYSDPGTVTTVQFQQGPVTGDPPVGTGPGTFTIDFPSSGVGLTVWNGGTIEEMAEGARVGGARSMFITVNGRWVSYSIAGPSFVNANFAAQFPGGAVPAGTVVLVVM